MPKCQLAHFHITTQQATFQIDFIVPAYTRSSDDLMEKVATTLSEYIDESIHQGEPTSIADFVMYLLTVAMNEPKEQ